MNRNTKIVLLVSLFGLVCLAILWGRWFPDNRQLDDPGLIPPEFTANDGSTFGESNAAGEKKPYEPVKLVIGVDPPLSSAAPTNNVPLVNGGQAEPTPPANDGQGRAPQGELPGWRQHTVAKNDALWKIAELYLGDGTRFREIEAANPGVNAKTLKQGSVLRIPPRDKGGRTEAAAALPRSAPVAPDSSSPAPSADGARTYTVQSGDTLSHIASRQLGSAAKWAKIAQLNGLSEPYDVRPGDVLKLP